MIQEFKGSVLEDQCFNKDAQVGYDIFQMARAKMIGLTVVVHETHVTGSLILGRLISTVWEGEERLQTLQINHKIREELSQKRIQAPTWR